MRSKLRANRIRARGPAFGDGLYACCSHDRRVQPDAGIAGYPTGEVQRTSLEGPRRNHSGETDVVYARSADIRFDMNGTIGPNT